MKNIHISDDSKNNLSKRCISILDSEIFLNCLTNLHPLYKLFVKKVICNGVAALGAARGIHHKNIKEVNYGL